MKRFIWIVLLVISLTTITTSTAQDTAECTADTVTALITTIQGHTDTAASLEPADALDELQLASDAIAAAKAGCNGLSFSGDADSVIGPVTIPEGVYRAVATTENYMIVHIEPLDGECGEGTRMRAGSLFNISEGEADEGAEAILASAECSTLIEVQNVRGDWTLIFEKVS